MPSELITLSLLVVFFLCALGVVLLGLWIYRKGPESQIQNRVERFVIPAQEEDKKTESQRIFLIISGQEVSKFRERLNNALRIFSSEKMHVQLSSAYWPITDTEYILIRILGALLAFFLGWQITGGILGGILIGVIAVMLPPIILDRSIVQRQKNFSNQLLDVLVMIQGAVQSGYSFLQALDLAINEVPDPASEEFNRVLNEIRLGLSLEGALFNLVERMENDDLHLVVTAIIINAQVGGNLSSVLEASTNTIRDRMQLMGEIRSLTSYSRFVGSMLTLMPFLAGLAIFLINPGYFDTVLTSLFTQIAFAGAIFSVIIGNIWMQRIVKIKV